MTALGRHGELRDGEVGDRLDRLPRPEAQVQSGRPFPGLGLSLLEGQRGSHIGHEQGVPGRRGKLTENTGVVQGLEHPAHDREEQPLGGGRAGDADRDRQHPVARRGPVGDAVESSQHQRRLAYSPEARDQERSAARVQDAALQLFDELFVSEGRQRTLARSQRLMDVAERGLERYVERPDSRPAGKALPRERTPGRG